MTSHAKQLLVPPKAADDPAAWEILRLWIAQRHVHVSILPSWDESGHWGIALADIIRQVADAYQKSHGIDSAATVEHILTVLRAEFEHPTGAPTGDFAE